METIAVNPVYSTTNRQANHWLQAALQLLNFEKMASAIAWQGIDSTLGNLLKATLQKSVQQVIQNARELKSGLEGLQNTDKVPPELRKSLRILRMRYLKAEETVHFYTTAINSRTTPEIGALLRACDILCLRSMKALLDPLGMKSPYVLTYVEKGIGASILKAGLKLWDGNTSPVAAVKITQHNLFRPTAIIHETGHQIAQITDWNSELTGAFMNMPGNIPEAVKTAFSGWSSEIAADAFAFVHCGYASVAALHDVISGTPHSVFAWMPHDPHPTGYIRVMLNIAMCRHFYGNGPWEDLEQAFKNEYNIDEEGHGSKEFILLCLQQLPRFVQVILDQPYRAFGHQSLTRLIDPQRVSPQSLLTLQKTAGAALFTSHAWIWKECIRLLAVNGSQIAVGTGDLAHLYKQQQEWMVRLGFSIELN